MSHEKNKTAMELDSIRNVGIIAHIDAGKTTLSERFLYYSGKTHRIGEVDNGNTVMDYLDEERARGITIVAAAASFTWKHEDKLSLIHLIDTPGHIDFTAEVERSLRVIDGAVVIFSGVEGVEAQSEKVWRQSNRYNIPKIAFINKLDRIGASYSRVLREIRGKFSDIQIVPLQIPIGVESDFTGIVDLISMKACYFEDDDGSKVKTTGIPENMIKEAELAREEMLGSIAELADPIEKLYLEEKPIPQELLKHEIRRLVLSNRIVPIFAGAAKRNIGAQLVLNAIVDFLPSPNDRNVYSVINPKTGEHSEISIDNNNFCGLVFKVIASGSANLLYLRTYTGKLHLNNTLLNPRTQERVRVKRLLRLYSKNVESIDEVGPGDIVGIIGPAGITTGDTLCAINNPVLLEKINFPEPVLSIAVEPKSNKDRERLDSCLDLLCREDPTLTLRRCENTGQQLLSGMGELHLEINCHRIKNEFNVDARFGIPQVAFRETLKKSCLVTGLFQKTIGEQELYAEIEAKLEPVHRLETGIVVTSDLKNKDMIPPIWVETAEETLNNGLRTGGNWGYPLIYIKGTITAIHGNDEKTTDSAIAGAVLNSLHQAISTGTILLEPIMKLDIISPENVIGEITGYLQARRAVIHRIENLPETKHLSCEVPLAEMFGFSKALPKLSGGRAAFSMEPCGYQKISPEDLERMVNRQTRIL